MTVDILRWVAGSSQRADVVVDPGGACKVPKIAIDWVANAGNAVKMNAQLLPGSDFDETGTHDGQPVTAV